MRLWPRSVRAQVTLMFALGAAAALAAGLALLYLTLDRQLRMALDADLASRGADLAAAVSAGDIGAVDRDPMAQLYDVRGAVLAGSPALAGQRLIADQEVRDAPAEAFISRTAPLGHDGAPVHVRLRSQRLAPHGDVLTVGVSAAAVNEARTRLLEVLLIAGPALIGAVAVAGWLVVRAALQPVDALTREAAAFSSLDTGGRLPAVPGDDEIARLARTLNGMLDRLRAAFARERAFVDDASHELRTPLAVLRGEIELALSTHDPGELRRSLHAALGESEKLSRLAEDLLLLAREQAGSLTFHRAPVDLLDLAAAVAGRLEPALGLRISVTGDPTVIEGDADRLRQVLANLAANSASAGASRAQVRVTRDRYATLIEVADDGPGFPPGILDSAFDRFVRGDDARTRDGSGAGLGLSIVRAVVAASGGTVGVRNGAPLGGAVVTIRLAQPHPGIEQGVSQVDGDVGERDEQRCDQDDADDDR
jgi:signal transduction histidine kinase